MLSYVRAAISVVPLVVKRYAPVIGEVAGYACVVAGINMFSTAIALIAAGAALINVSVFRGARS